MPKEHNEGDMVCHKQYGIGQVVQKTGPTFVKSMGEIVEATYLVNFPNCKEGIHVPSLYYDELKPALCAAGVGS